MPVATPTLLNAVGSPVVGKVEWSDNSLNQLGFKFLFWQILQTHTDHVNILLGFLLEPWKGSVMISSLFSFVVNAAHLIGQMIA